MIMNMPDNSADIKEIKNTLGYTASKNLLENTGVTNTKNGITYTVNDDGSVTINGTANSNSSEFIIKSNLILPNGEYILSGCPEGGSDSSYDLEVYWLSSNSFMHDIGQGVNFSINDNNSIYYIRIFVESNTTVNNLTFYPMIRKASITDDTYEPYVGSVDVRLDSVESAVKWKLVGSFTGGNYVYLPSDFKELFIVTQYTDTSKGGTWDKIVIKDSMSYYKDNTVTSYVSTNMCQWKCTNTYVQLKACTSNSNNILTSYPNMLITYVYYR